MKKYWLFAGTNYYPSGGMQDFAMSSESMADLQSFANIRCPYAQDYKYDWWHIVDSTSGQVVLDHYSRDE